VSENQKTQKNELIEVNINKKKNCLVELNVIAQNPIIKKAYEKAIKEIAKSVEIPGFRKGKAPKEMILQKHKDSVEEQTKKALADEIFIEAEKLIKIPLLSSNSRISFDLKDYSLDGIANAVYIFETEPTPPTIDPKKFVMPEIKEQGISEKDVEEYLRQMRFFYATWTEVTDREIQENDFVILDLESLKDEKNPSKVFSNTRFEIANKSIAQWMKKLLLGAKKGDVIDGTSYPDEKLPAEEKEKFEQQKVRITVQKIESPKLPELNDEFAVKMGVASVDDLKKAIKDMLDLKAQEKFQNEKKEAINKFLLTTYNFDLPLSMLENEKESRKNSVMQNPEAKKRYEAMTPEKKKSFEEILLSEATDAIKLFYLSKKIVEDAKISITKEEINEHMQSQIAKGGEQKDVQKEDLALVASRLLLAKAQNYVIENSSKS
jgi:trigger factor